MSRHDIESLSGELLEDRAVLSLADLCRIFSVDERHIVEMVEEGVISVFEVDASSWRFSGTALRRTRVALRLERDLGMNFPGWHSRSNCWKSSNSCGVNGGYRAMTSLESDAFVFFGATGDLAYKKIFPALYAMAHRDGLDIPVIGMARSGWNLEKLRERARDSLEHAGSSTEAVRQALPRSCATSTATMRTPRPLRKLRKELGAPARPIHYLAIPPSMFASVVKGLGGIGLREKRARDRGEAVRPRPAIGASAQQDPARVFPEESIFRIDHYLGKEAGAELLYFRFANTFLEPIWNRNTSRTCRSPWPRASACRGAANSTKRRARSATSCRTTCSR